MATSYLWAGVDNTGRYQIPRQATSQNAGGFLLDLGWLFFPFKLVYSYEHVPYERFWKQKH